MIQCPFCKRLRNAAIKACLCGAVFVASIAVGGADHLHTLEELPPVAVGTQVVQVTGTATVSGVSLTLPLEITRKPPR